MYNWGYLKNAILAKLDLDGVIDEDEKSNMNYENRFPYYANEAMTMICSSVMPKRTFFEIEIHNGKYDELGNLIEQPNVNKVITLPNDFISFGDDVNLIDENVGYGTKIEREVSDDDFEYVGYNKIRCFSIGNYKISYNARWYNFKLKDESTFIDVPADILEAVITYVASQCMKVDDEQKAAMLRNEFEMQLARIDDTNYKSNKTFKIGGDW